MVFLCFADSQKLPDSLGALDFQKNKSSSPNHNQFLRDLGLFCGS